MTTTAPAPTATTCPPADLERRFYAFVIDRAVTWGLYAGGGYLAWRLLVEPGRTLAGVLAVLALVLAVMGVSAALLALAGLSPGKAALGLRVVPSGAGAALGPGAAALRTLVVGLAGPPTLGLGAATLAWTAVSDPGGRRRGWHDHLSGTVVVDVRPAPVVHEPPAPAPAPLVNLTTMRLMPVAPHPVAAPGPPVVQAPAVPRRIPAGGGSASTRASRSSSRVWPWSVGTPSRGPGNRCVTRWRSAPRTCRCRRRTPSCGSCPTARWW